MKRSDPSIQSIRALMVALAALSFSACERNKTPTPETSSAALGSASSSAESAAVAPSTPPPAQSGAMATECPMHVAGVKTSFAETNMGAGIIFTTSTGDVADLRARVRKMAEWHNGHLGDGGAMMGHGPHHAMMGHGGSGMMGCGMMGYGMMGRGGPGMMGHGMMGHGGRGMMGHGMSRMIPSTASAQDVEGGVRLELIPKDPAQLKALREHVREHAARMASGECPMCTAGAGGGPSVAHEMP